MIDCWKCERGFGNKPRGVAALHVALGGLPGKMPVEVEPDILFNQIIVDPTPGSNWGMLSDRVYSVQAFDAVATPLPGALPLLASGLGAMGLLGWRRKRKRASAD